MPRDQSLGLQIKSTTPDQQHLQKKKEKKKEKKKNLNTISKF